MYLSTLTDAYLQRTCSEIVHVQLQSCDHILYHARINSFFLQKLNNVFSSSIPGGYLNFSTCFMKNVLLAQKMRKSQNKLHFVENKPDIMQHDKTAVNFLPALIYKMYFQGCSTSIHICKHGSPTV
jgi:hypothetical protein